MKMFSFLVLAMTWSISSFAGSVLYLECQSPEFEKEKVNVEVVEMGSHKVHQFSAPFSVILNSVPDYDVNLVRYKMPIVDVETISLFLSIADGETDAVVSFDNPSISHHLSQVLTLPHAKAKVSVRRERPAWSEENFAVGLDTANLNCKFHFL